MSPFRRASDLRRALREKAAHVTPRTVVEYPLEVFVSFLGLIIGIPLLAGLARPESLALLLPPVAYIAYSLALILGGLTVAVSLRRDHAAGLASGIQLLGRSFVVYAFAVAAVAGWAKAWAAFACFFVLGIICLARAGHFRRLIDIQIGARRLRRRS